VKRKRTGRNCGSMGLGCGLWLGMGMGIRLRDVRGQGCCRGCQGIAMVCLQYGFAGVLMSRCRRCRRCQRRRRSPKGDMIDMFVCTLELAAGRAEGGIEGKGTEGKEIGYYIVPYCRLLALQVATYEHACTYHIHPYTPYLKLEISPRTLVLLLDFVDLQSARPARAFATVS